MTAIMLVFAMLVFLPEAIPAADAEGIIPNYCNKQDNNEAPYDGSYWKQPERWGSDPVDPEEYTGDVRIWLDKVTVKSNEARGKVQRVYCHVSGAEGKVNSVSVHIVYDTRLTPKKNGSKYVINGDSLRAFASVQGSFEPGVLELIATCNLNTFFDGNLFYVDFILPDDAMPGDIYPIGIRYDNSGPVYDLFYNAQQDYEGKLTMAYVFTKGIENGYIAVEDNKLIVFEANGGTGKMKSLSRNKDTASYTLPDCGFDPPEGKEFDCWEYPSGSKAGREGDLIPLNGAVTTLKARWKNSKVSRVDISVNGPAADKGPSFTADSLTNGAEAYDVIWFDGDTRLSEEDTFEEGKEYRVQVTVDTLYGYVFAGIPEVYINDTPAEKCEGSDADELIYSAVLTVLRYEVEDPETGDINGDGYIDIEDAVIVINHINGIYALTDERLKRSDMDGSETVDIEDAVALINHVIGSSFTDPEDEGSAESGYDKDISSETPSEKDIGSLTDETVSADDSMN